MELSVMLYFVENSLWWLHFSILSLTLFPLAMNGLSASYSCCAWGWMKSILVRSHPQLSLRTVLVLAINQVLCYRMSWITLSIFIVVNHHFQYILTWFLDAMGWDHFSIYKGQEKPWKSITNITRLAIVCN